MNMLIRCEVGRLFILISIVLLSFDSYSESEVMTGEEFRKLVTSPNFNPYSALSNFDSRKQGEYTEIMKVYTDVIEKELSNNTFDNDTNNKSDVYTFLQRINYHEPIVAPVVWENVLKDVLSGNGQLRLSASKLAAFSPEVYRDQFLKELKRSIELFGLGDYASTTLQSMIRLIHSGERDYDDFFKEILDEPSLPQGFKDGVRTFALAGILQGAGIIEMLEFAEERSVTDRVSAATALARMPTNDKNLGTRVEEEYARRFLTKATIDYLETTATIDRVHDIMSALINALFRTVGPNPKDTSQEQKEVNLELVESMLSILPFMEEDARMTVGMKDLLTRFSDDGIYTR